MGDSPNGWNSWNCSSTFGPKGMTCNPNITVAECYYSCDQCDPCDWSSCYDDINFFKHMITKLKESFCIDEEQMHYSGISNGGMFAYYLAAFTEDSLGLATLNPVAASSLIGFGKPSTQSSKVSIIDFHGILDDVIPYDELHSFDIGPDNSLMSEDGFYYDKKETLIGWWQEVLGCSEEMLYPTEFDGQYGFQCLKSTCLDSKEIVRCFGEWTHEYPIPGNDEVSARIAYNFMVNHPKN